MPNPSMSLKPCPFCGRDVRVVCVGGGWFWKHVNYEHRPELIEADCPIRFSHKYETEQEAIDAWNKRYEEPIKNQDPIKPILIISKEDS